MAMQDADIAELEKLIKKARQKELPFGLCLGKKPEDNVMCMDLKKSPEVMMRKAKAEGETAKVTYGTCAVKGKIIALTLEGKMLPGLAKNMKQFMTKVGIKMKVVITDPDGNLLDSEGDEDEVELTAAEEAEIAAEIADDPQTEDAAADPLMGQWAQVSAKLVPLVDTFLNSSDVRVPKIRAAWEGATTAANNEDYKSALAVAKKLAPVLSEGPQESDAAPATDPDALKWAKLEDPIGALFRKAMSRNPPDRTKLEAAWAMANEAAGGGDYAKAIAIVTRLKPLLDKAAEATDAGQDGEIPKDVVPFQKSRILWESTRKKMLEEIAKLEKAIKDACGSDEQLAEVAKNASSLPDRLKGFDSRLEEVLETITVTPEGPERSKLKQDAVGILEGYQSLLQDPFFADVDNNNGFVQVKVAASATASLASISKVLAA